MTVSTHTYTATLIGTPDRPLAVRGGRIRLDAGTAPHVTAQLEIAVPDEDVLDELDTRELKRVVVTADAVFPDYVQARSFDLALRTHDMGHSEGVVTLDLSSDEAILGDHAPLTTDTSLQDETSLRALVDYVLSKIGASLEATPADDADVTAYWELTNYITNPSAEVNTTGWGPGTGTSAIARITGAVPATPAGTGTFRWTASGAGQAFLSSVVRIPVREKTSYIFSGYYLGTAPARQVQPMVRFTNDADEVLRDVYGTAVLASTTTWQRYAQQVTAPAGATTAIVHLRSVTNTAGQFHYADGFMYHEGDREVDYFDGSIAPAGYTTEWDGDTPHAAASTRIPDVERPLEALTWRAGVSGIEFVHPLVQAAGLRLVCDEERSWTLRGASYVAPGSVSFAQGVDLVDARNRLSRDDETWFDGQVTVYRDRDGNEREDAFALTATPTKVIRVDVDAPYPGPGRSEYAVRRAQGRGREVTATKVADWDARAEQPVTATLLGVPDQVGLTEAVEFDLYRDEVTATTRTTDAVPGSIALLGGMIDALPGMIDAL